MIITHRSRSAWSHGKASIMCRPAVPRSDGPSGLEHHSNCTTMTQHTGDADHRLEIHRWDPRADGWSDRLGVVTKIPVQPWEGSPRRPAQCIRTIVYTRNLRADPGSS